jgi:hypothetical protein
MAGWPVPDNKLTQQGKQSDNNSKPINAQSNNIDIIFTPLHKLKASGTPPEITDLFPQQTWAPPSLPVTPTTPVAPPLPFTYSGRYTEGDKVIVFLMDGNRILRVQAGDILKNDYRVEKIEQASISINYLPLGTIQILPTGVLLP